MLHQKSERPLPCMSPTSWHTGCTGNGPWLSPTDLRGVVVVDDGVEVAAVVVRDEIVGGVGHRAFAESVVLVLPQRLVQSEQNLKREETKHFWWQVPFETHNYILSSLAEALKSSRKKTVVHAHKSTIWVDLPFACVISSSLTFLTTGIRRILTSIEQLRFVLGQSLPLPCSQSPWKQRENYVFVLHSESCCKCRILWQTAGTKKSVLIVGRFLIWHNLQPLDRSWGIHSQWFQTNDKFKCFFDGKRSTRSW